MTQEQKQQPLSATHSRSPSSECKDDNERVRREKAMRLLELERERLREKKAAVERAKERQRLRQEEEKERQRLRKEGKTDDSKQAESRTMLEDARRRAAGDEEQRRRVEAERRQRDEAAEAMRLQLETEIAELKQQRQRMLEEQQRKQHEEAERKLKEEEQQRNARAAAAAAQALRAAEEQRARDEEERRRQAQEKEQQRQLQEKRRRQQQKEAAEEAIRRQEAAQRQQREEAERKQREAAMQAREQQRLASPPPSRLLAAPPPSLPLQLPVFPVDATATSSQQQADKIALHLTEARTRDAEATQDASRSSRGGGRGRVSREADDGDAGNRDNGVGPHRPAADPLPSRRSSLQLQPVAAVVLPAFTVPEAAAAPSSFFSAPAEDSAEDDARSVVSSSSLLSTQSAPLRRPRRRWTAPPAAASRSFSLSPLFSDDGSAAHGFSAARPASPAASSASSPATHSSAFWDVPLQPVTSAGLIAAERRRARLLANQTRRQEQEARLRDSQQQQQTSSAQAVDGTSAATTAAVSLTPALVAAQRWASSVHGRLPAVSLAADAADSYAAQFALAMGRQHRHSNPARRSTLPAQLAAFPAQSLPHFGYSPLPPLLAGSAVDASSPPVLSSPQWTSISAPSSRRPSLAPLLLPVKARSNRQLLMNAVSFTLLSAPALSSTRLSVLQAIAHCPAPHLLLQLTESPSRALSFKAVYATDVAAQQAVQVWAAGAGGAAAAGAEPITASDIDRLYKYDSGRKEFVQISSRRLTPTTDAFSMRRRRRGRTEVLRTAALPAAAPPAAAAAGL